MAKTYEAIQKSKQLSVIENRVSPYLNPWTPLALKEKNSLGDIYSKIELMSNPSDNKAFHFASAKKGEGTSTVLFNLARYIARMNPGRNVLLVDGNVERPTFHTAFNKPLSPGLCEILNGSAKLSDAIHNFESSHVYIMPSGNATDNRFRVNKALVNDLIKTVRKKFQYILLDSPPLLTSSVARMWASVADVSFLVIRANRTQWEVARKAQTLLEKQGDTFGGAILNGVRYGIPAWIYNRI